MAQQHTTPEKSMAAARAAEQRAQTAGHESRMKKDPCFELYGTALKCLDEHDYNKDMCEEAFNNFNECRLEAKSIQRAANIGQAGDTSIRKESSPLQSMLAAAANDPISGWLWKFLHDLREPSDAAPAPTAAAAAAGQAEPEPEWRQAKRAAEQAAQQEQHMKHLHETLLEQQQQQQQAQQQQQQQDSKGQRQRWKSWFSKQ